MKHNILTLALAMTTGRQVTVDTGGTIGKTNFTEKTVTGKVAGLTRIDLWKNNKISGCYYNLTMHLPTGKPDEFVVNHFAYLPPKEKGNKITSEANPKSATVSRKNGLHLFDLVQLVANQGIVGDNPFLALSISGVDTHESRIVQAVEEINDEDSGPGGVLYLYAEPKLKNVIDAIVGDAIVGDEDELSV